MTTGGLALTVLGCTGSYPGPDRACSGYLLEGGGQRLMLDAGPGTVANLQRHVALDALTALVLTHVHPDHWTDFGVLRTALKYGFGREGFPVFGTVDTRAVAEHMVGHDLAPTIDWTVVGDGDEVILGPVWLRFSATDHYVETLAVRAEHRGTVLAYSADTGPGWTFSALGTGIGTALCEATLSSREGPDAEVLHLTASEAGRLAREAGIERLLLTHLPIDGDPEEFRWAAEETFGGPVEIVSPNARYEL